MNLNFQYPVITDGNENPKVPYSIVLLRSSSPSVHHVTTYNPCLTVSVVIVLQDEVSLNIALVMLIQTICKSSYFR